VKDAIGFAFLGLGAGGFIAMMATGLVVAFKGSGVINFSHGAVAMYAAFTYNYLRLDGTIRLPLVDILPTHQANIPVKISLASGGPVDKWVAIIISLLMSVLIGAAMHYLVFKPLRNAAPLGKVIGAIGVMLYLQGVALVNFGAENPQPEPVLFPNDVFQNFLGFGKPLPVESLALAIVAGLVGLLLWFNYKFTRFGLATRAAAGNEKGAVLLGYSPERLALSNWIIAAVTAGIAGVLVGSVTGALNVVKFTTLIVPALGAALIGSLSSVPIAIAGGIGIGMLQTVVATWMSGESWFPEWLQSGATDAIPLVIIVAVLFLRGKALPVRGNIQEKRLPLSPYPKRIGWYVAVFVPLGAILAFGLPGDFIFSGLSGKWGFAFTTTLIGAMLMLSYVLLAGYVGQISMVQLSIAGVAAFFMARMTANGNPTPEDPFAVSGPGLAWPIAAILGIVVAVAVGIILGIPALRSSRTADAVLRQRQVDEPDGGVQRGGALTDVLRNRHRLHGFGGSHRLTEVRIVLRHRSRAHVRDGVEPASRQHRTSVPRGTRQRACGCVGRCRRSPHEVAGVRSRLCPRGYGRRHDRVPATADLVGQLGVLRRPRDPRLRLPRWYHLGQRRGHRWRAHRFGCRCGLRCAPVRGSALLHAGSRRRRNDPHCDPAPVGPVDALPADCSVLRQLAEAGTRTRVGRRRSPTRTIHRHRPGLGLLRYQPVAHRRLEPSMDDGSRCVPRTVHPQPRHSHPEWRTP